ncbi:hypothetical protein AB6D11_06115 [Vibrio splendidus]
MNRFLAIPSLLFLLSFATPSIAERNSQQTLYGYTKSEIQKLSGQCGTYKAIGPTTVFGQPSEYNGYFNDMGIFHSKMERISGLTSQSRSFAAKHFKESRQYQWDVYRMLAQQEASTKRYDDHMQRYDDSAEYINSLKAESRKELEASLKYNTNKTLNEVGNVMRDNPPRSYSKNSTESMSDMDTFVECEEWWRWEIEHPDYTTKASSPFFR